MKRWEKIKLLLETPDRETKIVKLFELMEEERRKAIKDYINRQQNVVV